LRRTLAEALPLLAALPDLPTPDRRIQERVGCESCAAGRRRKKEAAVLYGAAGIGSPPCSLCPHLV